MPVDTIREIPNGTPPQVRVTEEALHVVEGLFGVPSTFTNMMCITNSFTIQEGQLNKPHLRAQIPNEGFETSRAVQGVVTATNIVGQIFKASKDNITALAFTAESAAAIVLDDFDSYANSAALQVEWVASGTLATLDTTIYKSTPKSMKLPLDVAGDSWEDTIASTDFTGYLGSFDLYQDNILGLLKVYIVDNVGNKKYRDLPLVVANEWAHFDIAETSMTEDAGNTLDTDVTQIVGIGYEVVTKRIGAAIYIDNLEATPPPGFIGLKLWNMGATIPVSATTSIDDGIQYAKLNGSSSSVEVQLDGGKRLYQLHDDFKAGENKQEPLTNELLIPGNYYILQFYYVDTNVSIYGTDPALLTNNYVNGYAFTAPDEATAITAIGQYNDCMFVIQSMQDVYIVKCGWFFDATPNGDSDIFVYAEDTTMAVVGLVVSHWEKPPINYTFDLHDRPIYLEDGGKLEFYYNDDWTDSVTSMTTTMTFLFESPNQNG